MAETTLADTVALLKREVDALQVEVMRPGAPWYKAPSVVISTLALLFSFGSTMVSYQRTEQLDRQAARAELRGLIQRLEELPLKQRQFQREHADDADLQAYAQGNFAHEQAMLAGQAAELVERIPNDVTSTEAYGVGFALAGAGFNPRAYAMLDLAVERADDPMAFIASKRQLGAMRYRTGDLAGAAAHFGEALNPPDRVGALDDGGRRWFNGATYLFWAREAAGARRCADALGLLDQADAQYRPLPRSPALDPYRSQIFQTRTLMTRCVADAR